MAFGGFSNGIYQEGVTCIGEQGSISCAVVKASGNYVFLAIVQIMMANIYLQHITPWYGV
jgi:hypothetical protein